MSVLIIGEAEHSQIDKIVAYARANPVSLDFVRASAVDDDKPVLELKDRKPGFERPPSQHVIFPGGYRAAFSIEMQPIGWCTHLSVSVFGRPKKGMVPSPEAVAMIALAFNVPFPAVKAWLEEYEPGEYAVNLVSPLNTKTMGNA